MIFPYEAYIGYHYILKQIEFFYCTSDVDGMFYIWSWWGGQQYIRDFDRTCQLGAAL